jgi:hypothetical protein
MVPPISFTQAKLKPRHGVFDERFLAVRAHTAPPFELTLTARAKRRSSLSLNRELIRIRTIVAQNKGVFMT